MPPVLNMLCTLLCLLMVTSSARAEPPREWIFVELLDPVTNEIASAALMINPSAEVLMVGCDGQDHFNIFIRAKTYLGTGHRPVSYRVDDQPTVDAGGWGYSADGFSVYAPYDLAANLVEKLRSGGFIHFQITDYKGIKHFPGFSLAGSAVALRQLDCVK